MLRSKRLSVLSKTGIVVSAATVCVVGLAAPASAATATVGNTDGDGLNVRAAPNTSSAVVDLVHTGQVVEVSCQEVGESVTNTYGFTSSLWDYLPARGGYVADAYMATGYDWRIPGVPDCDEGGGGGAGDLVPISQFQGQPNQGEDCGPTSVVTALLAAGITPRGWDPGWPVGAINQARRDMGYDPSWNNPNQFGTNEQDVINALAANGVSAWTVWYDLDTILAHVRAGSPVILAGNMVDLPWSGNYVAHFLTVAGYDSDTGEYLVLDPASDTVVYRASWSTLAAYFDHDYGRAGILL